MDKIKLKNVIEAILIASDRILSLSQLEKLLSEQSPVAKKADNKQQRHAANDDAPAADVENTAVETMKDNEESETPEFSESTESANLKRSIKEVIEILQSDYSGRAMELKEVASGYRFQVRQGYADYVGKLWEERPAKYSRALLETLVLIAYRQPITRGEIEAIRGVSVSSHIVKTMIERDWVRVIGHRDVPGKPSIYGTTKEFLDYFNLTSLDELPSLADVKDLDKVVPELALDNTDGQGALAEAAAQPAQHRKQIEIRQARRSRRMRRQFGQSDENASGLQKEVTTSQENESDQVEMS